MHFRTMTAASLALATGAAHAQICETDTLLAAAGAGGDTAGFAVAVGADRAVVGAPFAASNAGRATVFMRTPTGWIEETTLTAGDGANGDFFGVAVAVEGDRIVVGAPFDDDDGISSGAAYVFRLVVDRWMQEAKLTADDAGAGDEFGRAVGLRGDRAIVGAPRWDAAALGDIGAVYVYRGSDEGAWTQMTRLEADGGFAGDQFGRSVAADGTRFLAGAPFDDGGAFNIGAAYLFDENPPGTWNQLARLGDTTLGLGANLGLAVALRGDFALLGAPGTAPGGVAVLFRAQGSTWPRQALLVDDAGSAFDDLGAGVALLEGLALVGGPGIDAPLADEGAVLVYGLEPLPAGPTAPTERLVRGAAAPGDRLGTALASRDGRLVAGATEIAGSGGALVFGRFVLADCNANGVDDACDLASGKSGDLDGDGVPDECAPLPGDGNGDGFVNEIDLLNVVDTWGECPPPPAPCTGDGNGDGVVDVYDLVEVILNWAPMIIDDP